MEESSDPTIQVHTFVRLILQTLMKAVPTLNIQTPSMPPGPLVFRVCFLVQPAHADPVGNAGYLVKQVRVAYP
jgi:hypothetical protein